MAATTVTVSLLIGSMTHRSVGGALLARALAFLVVLFLTAAASLAAQTATLTGRVIEPGGAGVADVTVAVTELRSGTRSATLSGADGQYTLGGLAAGTYRLVVDGAGYQNMRAGEVTLSAGQTLEHPIRLRVHTLEDVVVTAGTTNAAIVAADIERWQAADLADVFRPVPSVSVGGSVGVAQKIYLRGLEDTHLNVTVDGAALTGTLFHHIGRVSVEPELLERVDVQAGAGEATAGFGAIGGAIRFRTRDAQDLLAPGQRVGGLLRGGAFTNDGYRTSASAYGLLHENWGLLASYVLVDRDNMQDGAGNEMFGTSAEQRLAFVKLSGVPTDRQRLSLSYEQRDEEGEFGQRPNWPVMEGEPLFPGEAARRTAVATYSLDLNGAVFLEANGYGTRSRFTQDRYDRWGRYGAEMETWGFDLRNTSHLGPNRLTYGFEHRADRVTSRYLADPAVWSEWAWDPEVGRFVEEGDLYGAYLQNHLRLAAPLLLSAGVRWDSYSLEQVTYDDETSSSGFSGNIGLRFEPLRHLALSAGIAQAMRGKEVGDAFTLERRPGRITLAPDLDPERVTNAEIGGVWDDGRFSASASLYRMSIDDVIQDQLGGGPPPQDGVYYENIGSLESRGLELGLGYALERMRARLFFTTYDANLNGNVVEGYEHIGLANASGDKLDLSITWLPNRSVELGWNSTFVAGMEDIEVLHRALEIDWIDALQTVDKPGYGVHDASLRWRPFGGDRLTVDLAVQNLFDKQYRDHASVADYNGIPGWEGVAGLYESGRDIRISVGTRF